ncbi:hypothetical protein ABIE27_000894, partial [Paenibacillus sp. 4624]
SLRSFYRFHPSAGLPPSYSKRNGRNLRAAGREKSVEGALDAAGWIGVGRWLSPDF